MPLQPSRTKLAPITNQGNILSLKSNNNLKNILGRSNVGNQLLKPHSSNDLSKTNYSKIPIFRSKFNSSSALGQSCNQNENIYPGAGDKALVNKFRKECKVAPIAQSTKPSPDKPVIENIDKNYNCFLASEYADDIYKYLREVEEKQSLNPNFLSTKNSVQPHMRSILINWLIQVHQTFSLASETLYICVSMIDRYLARELVQKNRLQLVGVTSLFIAAKYEEIYYPEIGEFVGICDKLYTKRDIIKMELEILDKLNFELGRPLPLHFLRRISKAAKADGRTHMMAKYLCELTLIEYECAHWNPSLLAATALYLSLRLVELEKNGSLSPLSVDEKTFWTPTVEHYSGYKCEEIVKHAAILCKVIVNSETSKFQQCRKKYSSTKFMEISKASIWQHRLVKRLAGPVLPSSK